MIPGRPVWTVALLWEAGARLAQTPVIPPASAVLVTWWRLALTGRLWPAVWDSLEAILVGFGLAAVLGVGLGLGMVRYRLLDGLLMPVADSLRQVSVLALFPMFLTLLGLGLAARVAVVFWTAWPCFLITTVHGLRSTPSSVVDAGRIDGAVGWRMILAIRLPLARRTIGAGARLAVGAAWISIVAAEMLGSSGGLGWSILATSQAFAYAEMWAYIVTVALCGLGMTQLFPLREESP